MVARYRATCDCGFDCTYDSEARANDNLTRHVCRSDDGVRRATRRYRCARCCLEAVYENAGAKEARYWFSRHSCRKREEAMLRAALTEERMAAVDRTPKPCLHKQADHQHGTRACYVLDRCRCEPCSQANSSAENERTRLKAYGRYNKYVPSLPVREHVADLRRAGMGLKTIAARSGVSHGALWKLVYGKTLPDGTRRVTSRVLRTTAESLYALDTAWNGPLPLADGAVVSADEAVLRIRALVALGWSQSRIAAALGIGRSNFTGLAQGRHDITAARNKTISELYDAWSTQLPPQTNQRERIAASRARNYAKARGWQPPLALDRQRRETDREAVRTGEADVQWVKDRRGIWRAA